MHQGLVASLKPLCIEVSIFEFHMLSHDDEKNHSSLTSVFFIWWLACLYFTLKVHLVYNGGF
jgi:hypothetical protein